MGRRRPAWILRASCAALAVALAVVLAACAAQQPQVRSDYDRNADFGRFLPVA